MEPWGKVTLAAKYSEIDTYFDLCTTAKGSSSPDAY